MRRLQVGGHPGFYFVHGESRFTVFENTREAVVVDPALQGFGRNIELGGDLVDIQVFFLIHVLNNTGKTKKSKLNDVPA
ncbi:hypothetical protein SDC9_211180 [bioreactor metagenome]|uniref:Uncharacterized protein n=1 Tax=bioreactor metagenome TaxID=1076179 RepID=A0A645JII7_9ZZZZ